MIKGWAVLCSLVLMAAVSCSSGGGSDPADSAQPSQAQAGESSSGEPSDADIHAAYDTQFCIPFTRLKRTVRFVSQDDFEGHSIYKVKPMADGSAFSLTQGQALYEEWGDPIAVPLATMLEDLEAVSRSAELEVNGKLTQPWPDVQASMDAIYEVRDPCETEMPASLEDGS